MFISIQFQIAILSSQTAIQFQFQIVLKYDYIKKLINFGLPFLPAGIASITMESIDRYILSILTDTYTVGLYTAGYKLGIFMLIFSTAFNYAWQPFFLSTNKDAVAKKLFSKIFTQCNIKSPKSHAFRSSNFC